MNACNGNLRIFGCTLHPFTLLLRDIRDIFGNRKRCNFDPAVAGLSRELHRVLDFPALENLIANCEIHRQEAEMTPSNAQPFLSARFICKSVPSLATKSPP